MPIAIIAVLVITVLGAGAYFVTSNAEPTTSEPEVTDVARTDIESPSDEGMQDVEMTGSGDDDMMRESMMGDSMPDDESTVATPYSSEQTYLTPARTSHEIDVNLTVADDGTIIGANVVYDNGDGYSNPHQQRFDGAYQAQIIGQNISDAELAITGGASLTTGAFNEAIADVRAQRS